MLVIQIFNSNFENGSMDKLQNFTSSIEPYVTELMSCQNALVKIVTSYCIFWCWRVTNSYLSRNLDHLILTLLDNFLIPDVHVKLASVDCLSSLLQFASAQQSLADDISSSDPRIAESSHTASDKNVVELHRLSLLNQSYDNGNRFI